jgi:hypothetical protein
MKWNPKLVIALSTAVVLLGAQAKSLQAEPEGPCPWGVCIIDGTCPEFGAANACYLGRDQSPGCMASLQFAVCTTTIPQCGSEYGVQGVLCFWSTS